ncbi:MAG TPA: hypothetical protein VHS96_06630, partial [Bacteroidia bacterium]|nr:hypothetical protein [Bacteroidia bacterium]
SQPFAIDYDDDGDFDLLVGGIDVGINSAPQLVDLDGDNDLDLLLGNHRGYVHYYDNAGSVSIPSFELVDDTFGRVKMSDYTGLSVTNGFSQPFAIDYDDDGDFDLLVGGIDGQVSVFENISLVPGTTFAQANDLFGYDFGLYASIAAWELDSARLTYVVGDYRGGLMLLRDSGPVGVAEAPQAPLPQVKLFPNPAADRVAFEFGGAQQMSAGSYKGYDAFGREAFAGTWRGDAGAIALTELEPGFYCLVFSAKSGSVTCKLIITGK